MSSNRPDTEAGEGDPLRKSNEGPKPASPKNTDTCIQIPPSCQKLISSCKNRKLAITSIICGCTCLGIAALVYTIKAEGEKEQSQKRELSKRARKWSIISIVVWVSILALIPPLLALFSYLLTLID